MQIPRSSIAVPFLLAVATLVPACVSTNSPVDGLTYSGEDLLWGRVLMLQIRHEHLGATGGSEKERAAISAEILALSELRLELQLAVVEFEKRRLASRMAMGPGHAEILKLDTQIERLRQQHELLAKKYR